MTQADSPVPVVTLKSGVLTAGGIALIVVAAAAPLSLIAGYGPIGFLVGGIGAPAGFLVAGVVLAMFVVGILAMTRFVAKPGTFYAYIGEGLGPAAGTAAAALAITAYLTINIGGMGIVSATTRDLILVSTGIDVPWWVLGLIITALIWYVCRRGIDVGVKVLVLLLVAEVGILVVIAFAVLARTGPAELSFASFEPSNVFTPGMAAAALVWFGAYFGIESTTIYRAEAKNPARTIPRATVISLVFLAVFYCFVAWAIAQAFSVPDLAAAIGENPTALIYIIGDYYLGPWAGLTAQALLVTSSIASGIAYFNAVSRYGHSMGSDGILPRLAMRVHHKYRSPSFGNVQGLVTAAFVLIFGLLGLDPYLQLTVWFSSPGTLGLICLMALASIAVAVFFARPRPDITTARRVLFSVIAAIAAALLIGVLVMMILNIELLTGAGGTLNTIVVLTPAVVFVAAFIGSLTRRRSRRSVESEPSAQTVEYVEGV
ncbi:MULTISPECIES: APC family permease [unclassified Microbacterium]|uniref:APC family permease n=1 Tax=unclassified Microbacterium TaxID=2609290 RepID=UPI000EA83C62|nr:MULTISPECIES: APC family permease [unclassified Microbacterium]MBT2483560.1 APC family permease [Microbacterium sp. ISL-108]RKN66572.1 APC family permease [Microbacterium sp. CGR2]